MLLRVSPDGSYAKIVLNTYDSDMVGWLAEAAYRQAASPSPLSVITNADQGVAVFSPAAYQNGNLVNPQVTYVSGDAVTAQVSLTLNSPPWLAQCSPSCGYQYDGGGVVAFWPQLQRADGTYIGTVGLAYAGGECLTDDIPCPSAATVQESFNENSAALADVGAGGVIWQEEYPSSDNPAPILPLYTTSDGGTVVTSSQKTPPDITYGQFSLGTLYTLDQDGNITSQTADSGAVISWTGNWYADPPGFVSALFQSPILTNSLWAFLGGDPSGTGNAKRPWYFILNWQNNFTFVPSDPNTLPNLQTDITSDATQIKSAALAALKVAYKAWPVTVVEGTPGTGDILNEVQNVATDQNGNPTIDCGDFSGGIPPFSTVGYTCVMTNAQWALNVVINNAQDEAAALQRKDLIQAIGAGIGNISAHEIAHQFLGECCSMDATTSQDPNAAGTYNNGVKAGGKPTAGDPDSDVADYTGYGVNGKPIQWESTTQKALNACLAGGYREKNTSCPVPIH